MQYAENDNKTDKKLYVSAINCPVQRAYEHMMTTKLHYGKLGGNVAYHGYQSFAEGEVTPEECHSIGMETAKRMWGEEYEIVVTTHLDKEHHLHNHFVVNSVSFKTGRKFENHISDHYKLREISDAICRERGKSILENSPFYSGEKDAYWIHKKGNKTHRDMLGEDVELCLSVSTGWKYFYNALNNMGYTIDYQRLTIKAKGWERGVRLTSLGYTVEEIEERLNANLYGPTGRSTWNNYIMTRDKYSPLDTMAKRLEFSIEHSKKPDMIFVDTMFLLIILVFQLLKEIADATLLSPEMRHAAKDLKQFVADYHFLTDNQIHTTDDLLQSIEETQLKIAELEDERSKADNKKRRANTPEEKEKYKTLRKEITQEIEPLRKKFKQAEQILEKSPHLYELLQEELRLETNRIRKLERTR